MKNIWKWILLGALFFLVAFCVALPLLGGFAAMPRFFFGQGMMNRAPMMGGFGFAGFGLLGLALRCIVPVLLFAGIIALVVWLVRKPAATTPPAAPIATKACPSCGKPVQEGWVACPSCGQKL